MNDRKQHVLKIAHQLFINKGFHNTSIQDILEYSGISKGTFYNYFSSKNELFKEIFKSIFIELEKERNELLIGQDPANIEIFIKQMELQLSTNRKKMLIPLFEEVVVSNDEDLKAFKRQGQMRMIRWLYNRFIEIFGEDKEPYLLDMSVMFLGILNHSIKYYSMANPGNLNYSYVIRYCVNRIEKMVDEVSRENVQLIDPEKLANWLPSSKRATDHLKKQVAQTINALKKSLKNNEEQEKYFELLDFLDNELLHSKAPRKFLIESTINSLKSSNPSSIWKKEVQTIEQYIEKYYQDIREI